MITLRFDMRAPDFGAPAADLYAAALEMCTWVDTRGVGAVVLSEHHGTDDNHLPAPLLLASAIAARTENLRILLAAVVLPLYDPVRLAEDMSVLDLISGGRVSYVFGVGHRRAEYEQFDVDYARRGVLADEHLALLRDLLDGSAVDRDGRSIRVTPPPGTPGGPTFMVGGGSLAAAERAGRFGVGLLAQANPPGLLEAYQTACREHGHEPGPTVLPDPSSPTAVFVADDVDAAWDEIGPHLLHDARTAASYRHGGEVASISRATSVAELRASGGPYQVLTTDQAVERLRDGDRMPLAPLCGGLPPKVAWPYLRRAIDALQMVEGKPRSGQRNEPQDGAT